MTVWAIADLHLCFGVPEKSMEIFGPEWEKYTDKIESNWREKIRKEDLVLVAGDISWAMKPSQVIPDLEWIDRLPGTKVLLKGNHDYWWSSLAKVRSLLPPSLHAIQNDAFHWQDCSIAGARLWDTEEFTFDPYIDFKKSPPPVKSDKVLKEDRATFERELIRLELSLKELSPQAKLKIAMTHYPPVGPDLAPSRVSQILEKYHVNICVFGHLHSVKKEAQLFENSGGINYYLTAADYINFSPLKIYN